MNIYYSIFTNILDITITAFLLYQVMTFMFKSEKLLFIANAIVMIVVLYYFSVLLDLNILRTILSNVFSWGIVLIFIIFQNEIRGSLEKLGSVSGLSKGQVLHREEFLVDFTNTVFEMADEKMGALITFERDMPLSKYTDNAVKLNADYSSHLLTTIFNKESVLHDGAVVIKDKKIMYASTYFPISVDVNLDKRYGTRHRSALTISSETDSVTIIVSEERGTVSIAYKENLYTDLEKDFVLEYLKDKVN